MELERDSSAGLVQDGGVPGDRPVPARPHWLRRSRAGAVYTCGLVECRDISLREAGLCP